MKIARLVMQLVLSAVMRKGLEMISVPRCHFRKEAAFSLNESECDPLIAAPDPGEPTREEIDEHRIDHAQYRSWCEHCVRGRGRGQPHKSSTSAVLSVPVFVFDYVLQVKDQVLHRSSYLNMPEGEREEVDMKILVAKCCKTKCVFAYCVKENGADEAGFAV